MKINTPTDLDMTSCLDLHCMDFALHAALIICMVLGWWCIYQVCIMLVSGDDSLEEGKTHLYNICMTFCAFLMHAFAHMYRVTILVGKNILLTQIRDVLAS